MVAKDVKQDKHFPLFVHYNPVRRLFFSNPKKYCTYIARGQVIADLGCSPGYFTLSLAEAVGPDGTVYAVDSDEKAIRALERRAKKRGYHNIKTYTSSATNLHFLKDESVDFILADGLLCSMAPQHHEQATSEIQRILKPQTASRTSKQPKAPGATLAWRNGSKYSKDSLSNSRAMIPTVGVDGQ